jgi:hypothetical protein
MWHFLKIQRTVARIEANRHATNRPEFYQENIFRFDSLRWSLNYIASSTEFVISRRRKERGTSAVSVGSRTHFLTCHIQYGRRKVNSRSESLSRIIRRSSRSTVSREHRMGPSMSVCRVFLTCVASRVIAQQWEETSLLNFFLRKVPCHIVQ